MSILGWSMTLLLFARVQSVCTPARRWIRQGLLPVRMVPLETAFSAFMYEFNVEHLPLTAEIHEEKMLVGLRMAPAWR